MSTPNNATTCPFSIARQQQHFRLLELPPDLADTLTSPNPPTLYFKSSDSTAAKPAHAVLCTPSATYRIRQVQTSNAVYLTLPCSQLSSGAAGAESENGVVATATCDSTLELHKAEPTVSAEDYIRQEVTQYDESLYDGDDDNDDTPTASSKTKTQLYSAIPLHHSTIRAALRSLCVFDERAGGPCFLPSARVLLKAWQAMLDAAEDAIAQSARGPIATRSILEPLARHAQEAESHTPLSLYRAILLRLSASGPDGTTADGAGESTHLNQTETITWLGLTILSAADPTSPLSPTAFMQAWTTTLPERWRALATLDAIQGRYTIDGDTIRSSSQAMGRDGTAARDAGAATGRNWHEKFGRRR
ncbi:hypothetical protein LTR28_006547 [Elasticomyces elasticus]|nr:hypothetical protein LTR28_006547 [Elasticomyces elasticus]